jgi:nucleoside-diphosphate-sugar epimerase
MTFTLVTGATGNVGNAIVRALVAEGRPLRALARDPVRARPLVPAGCEVVRGDVTDRAQVEAAMRDVDVVYHAAGLPEQWLPDPGLFDAVNVGGTQVLTDAARAAGVRRFVYTSTIDVFAWQPGVPFDESIIDPEPKHTPYERSKQEADRRVARALADGLPAIFLHPSAVYGTSPNGSPGVNDFVVGLVRGEIPMLLPGLMPVVFSDDVARGHLLAESEPPGSRFILSESVWSLEDLAWQVSAAAREVLGVDVAPPRVMPEWVARVVSIATEGLSRVTRRPPLLPAGQLAFLLAMASPVATRARSRLGWSPVPFADGLRATLRRLVETGALAPPDAPGTTTG